MLVAVYLDHLAGLARATLVAYASFWIAFVAIAGTRHVNLPGADDVFTFPVHVAAVVVAVLTGREGRERGTVDD